MKASKYFITCLAIWVTLPSVIAQLTADSDLEQALQGAWCNSIDQGKTCWGFDVFDKGQTKYCGRLPSTGDVVYGSTSYTIRGNRVCHIVTSSNDDDMLFVGKKLCFDVMRIDAERQVFVDVETKDVDTLYRTSIDSVSCPKAGI